MNDDGPRPVGWIECVIASHDPLDRALAAEFAANWAASQAVNESILSEGATSEVLKTVEGRLKVSSELQHRVAARGKSLDR